MFNSDTELLFPSRVIPELRTLRGEDWRDLVDDVSPKDPTGIEYSAFVLVMARLSGCVTCTSDSFRAMKGCTQCARQTVRRFRGSDLELTALFQQAQEEITNNIKNRHKANDKE